MKNNNILLKAENFLFFPMAKRRFAKGKNRLVAQDHVLFSSPWLVREVSCSLKWRGVKFERKPIIQRQLQNEHYWSNSALDYHLSTYFTKLATGWIKMTLLWEINGINFLYYRKAAPMKKNPPKLYSSKLPVEWERSCVNVVRFPLTEFEHLRPYDFRNGSRSLTRA